MIRCPSRPLGTAPSLASGRWHSWVTFRPRGLPIEGRPRDSGQCRCFRWPLTMAVTNGCYCRNDAECAEPGLFVSAECCANRSATLLITHPMPPQSRSEEHTSELQSLLRIAYAVFCLKNQNKRSTQHR